MSECKTFSDPVYSTFTLHALSCRLLDTPEFQRLRNIKQLGGTSLVYQTASHSRLEHSLGVGWLAAEWGRILQASQPELKISDKLILCLELAGLCHDLGHGPFSHMFDYYFIRPRLKQGYLQYDKGSPHADQWEHEQASADMLDHIIQTHNMKPVFEQYGIRVPQDITFVKSLITGYQPEDSPYPRWVYQIVSNKTNHIDTDRFDYFIRDSHSLGLDICFNHTRMMMLSRVVDVETNGAVQQHIAFPEKEAYSIYEFFATRYTLHKKAYQHRVSDVIELMHCEVMSLSEANFRVPGSKGQPVSIAQSINDMVAYTHVTDACFEMIGTSLDPGLGTAKALLNRIKCRSLFEFIGEKLIPPDSNYEDESTVTEALCHMANKLLPDNQSLAPEDVFVTKNCIGFGIKGGHPFEHVFFYSKPRVNTNNSSIRGYRIKHTQAGGCFPCRFEEQWVRVYTKNNEPRVIRSLQTAWSAYISGADAMHMIHLAQQAVNRGIGHCTLDGSELTLLAEATLKYGTPVTVDDTIQNIPFNETPGWYLPGGKDHWFSIQLPYPELYGTLYTTRMPRRIDQEVTAGADHTDMHVFRHRCQAISTVVVLVDKSEMKNIESSQLLEYYRDKLHLNVIHHPIKDYATIPTGEMDILTERVLDAMRDGNCLVHCMGGSGRTGMVVVDVLKKLCVADPIEYCRSIKSVYLDTEAQVQFLDSLPACTVERNVAIPKYKNQSTMRAGTHV